MKVHPLPISVSDLLDRRIVESERLELKAGWNPAAIMRSACAFANDFQNLGGGYILIGTEAKDGLPVLPPKGVPHGQIDKIQKELLQYCHLIQPNYFPILSIEEVSGRTVLVIWCPGGQNRPYKVPVDVCAKAKDYQYYIRRYSSSIIAKGADLEELIGLTAKVPFDDRICHKADLEDLKQPLIRSFLKEVGSSLFEEVGKLPLAELCRQLAVVEGGDEYLKPRNVGILFFNDNPQDREFFPYARIEVVQFLDGLGGDNLEEKTFTGPLHQQLRDALTYLKNVVIKERVTKVKGQAEARHRVNYPYEAIEEALVNAVYHRSYELREPIEVRVNPDKIEILSYPGPDASIANDALNKKRIVARRYRNRRIGEFLKELGLTEGRATGIPKIYDSMERNGSPRPHIETDEGRTHFLIVLPVHPAFKAPVEVPVKVPVKVPVIEGFSLNNTERKILSLCKVRAVGRKEILAELGYSKLVGSVRLALGRLKELHLLELTIPDKPNSRNQQYRITDKGRQVLGVVK